MEFQKVDFQNSKLLYLQISDIIEKKILDKEIHVGKRIPPERELCKTFDVNFLTLRKALARLVDKGYLLRRQSHGTFVINSEPKREAGLQEHGEICLVTCPLDKNFSSVNILKTAFFHKVMEGAEKEIKENDAYLVYRSIDEDGLSLEGKEGNMAGLIVFGDITRRHFNIVKRKKIPFVLVGDIMQKIEGRERVDIISNDDFQGVYVATKHLIDLGHRRIAYVHAPYEGFYWELEKIRGYKSALEDAGITYNNNLRIRAGKNTTQQVYKLMKKLLKKPAFFSSLVFGSGIVCSGALEAVREKGMCIPGDLSIVNIGVLNGLTIVTYDYEEMGRTAVRRLIERIKGPDIEPKRIIVPNRLIAGNSTKKYDEYKYKS